MALKGLRTLRALRDFIAPVVLDSEVYPKAMAIYRVGPK